MVSRPIDVVHRPGHAVTVSLLFRAVTAKRDLLPLTLPAVDWMESGLRETVLSYAQKYGEVAADQDRLGRSGAEGH